MTNKINAFEIATWPCSEAYIKDQSIVHPAFEMLDGHLDWTSEIFYGVQVEEPNAYAVANWHTIEAHERFAADKERLHRFVKSALLCLGAPVTQIRKVKAREGVTLEAVQATLDKYITHLNTLTSESVGATYGQVVENPEEIMLVTGWRSIEARKDWEDWKEIREITEEEMSVMLKQYRKRVM
ncbi:hypothetical protein EI94DRAFT_1718718 [Lactarius quietus]|nr:hypothetical protein EI94DRAFT_1718718 [Lactarius quietus]